MSENINTYQPSQEIRIASVMFGGVSLAIYMNGITQELLRAIRATAPGATGPHNNRGMESNWKGQAEQWSSRRRMQTLLADGQLQSTEAIYRVLGRSLFHGREAGTPLNVSGPIQTRIVVDLLAGTSAGGINSVYLAKALANNQNLDELKQMWMDEADIDTLLNDSGSDPATFAPGPTTTSLLNSTRMYGLLYRAFENMDVKQKAGAGLADEIDLFVTTTDLDGVATPVQLADRMIEERIHKASFHFVYGPSRPGNPNDFVDTFNPMLAFASRCTSSFPVAFEPMTLEHIDRRIPGLSSAIAQDRNHPLRKFFSQLERNNPGIPFVRRPLADGGYLNNKPFSFVIDQIKLRTGTVPVIRKLLFLDPFPELDSRVRHTSEKIDFVQNARDAASTLPSYQTVREDIDKLNEYNRTLHAAQMLAREIEEEAPNLPREYALGPQPEAYPTRTLGNLVQQFGRCYRTYHRLRVSAVTNELASLVTKLADLNDCSDNLLAVRMLIHAWRNENFAPDGDGGKKLETAFLRDYDVGFRVRRAEYVRGRIDALLAAFASPADAGLNTLLATALTEEQAAPVASLVRYAQSESVFELFRLRDQIEFVKWKLSYDRECILIGTAGCALDPETVRRRNELLGALNATELTANDLGWILTPVQDEECQRRANLLYTTGERPVYQANSRRAAYSSQPDMIAAGPRPIRANIVKAGDLLAELYATILGTVSDKFGEALQRAKSPNLFSAVEIIREYVWVHYQYFDLRDMQVFTVMQDQLAGEGSAVEIYRVSPLDAMLLRTNFDPGGEKKLAGTALGAFGAFLSEDARRNDIMWGRLDGAERIIGAMLPDEADSGLHRALCEQAFEIIIKEEFTPNKCADLIRPLMMYLRDKFQSAGKTADEFLTLALQDSPEHCPEIVRQLLRSISEDEGRMAAFRAFYVKPADPPVKTSLARLRRAIRIFGEMLKELDNGNGPFTTMGGTAASIGAALTRFAEFCVPHSMPNVFFRYGLQLLYAIALVLIVTGALFYKEVETAGWVILAITASANIAAWAVAKWLFREKNGRKIALGILVLLLLVASIAAVLVRFQCELPESAWKAPLHSVAHVLDSRCAAK